MTKLKFGIPCSQLKTFTENVEINCTNEGEAMALACGAWFAGKEPVVYMQNSGLGHIVDIVTSLYKPYGIPLPKLVLSIRHSPQHHRFMGNMTRKLLNLLEYDNVEVIEQRETG